MDKFLEYRPEFLELGKLSIALSLIQFEKDQRLLDINKRGNSWYQYFYNKLDAPFEDFDKNQLSVITFNYDRSLEHYLFTSLKSSYGKSDEECKEKLNAIPIVHVHGRLGALPWQDEDGSRPYTWNKTSQEIKLASEKIKIVSESNSNSAEFTKAFELLQKAQRIYFLGFGYNYDNLRRLRLSDIKRHTRIPIVMGSGYDLGHAERVDITDRWKIVLSNPDLDVLAFLRNNAHL